jgi:eukaryotic-like serine/threonine-protein kinase
MKAFGKRGMWIALLLAIHANIWAQSGTGMGDVIWKHRIGGELWTPMVHEDGVLYLGSDDASFYAFDVVQREVRWRFGTGGIIRSGAELAGDDLYFASDDGFLYALNRENGELRWRFDLESGALERHLPPYGYDYMHSSPVYADGTVYIGSASGSLFAVDASTGEEVWRFQTRGAVRSTPLVANGMVYFGSWDGLVYTVDVATGEEVWRYNTGGAVQSSPTLGDGKIYISSRSAKMFALDAQTGKRQWRYQHEDGSWIESSAVYLDGVLYVGSSDATKLLAHDAGSGEVLWSFRTEGWSWGTPTVADGSVYIGSISAPSYADSMQANFYAVDRQTGEEQWRFTPEAIDGFVGGGVFSRAVVVDGVIYVAALDGYLYGLESAVQTTAIEELQGSLMPDRLLQPRAVPNPFNPQTSIFYHLPHEQEVELSIFDAVGRKVEGRSIGRLSVGNHQVAWDGTDASGAPVGSGPYFYALTGKDWRQTGKMMLLR